MAKRIVVNAGFIETRVAVQEGNVLTELYLERHARRSIVGSVYKGVVTNVLPGMQAAFVDIGLTKDAFLYAGDYTANLADLSREMLANGDEDADAQGETDVEGDVDEVEPPRREPRVPIEDALHKGQEVLVQVAKESLGTKGARVTSFISLPGRYLVYMPQSHHIGVSRRIHDEEERARLRAIIREREPAGGFIVRTNAEGKGEEEFGGDVTFLQRLWQQVQSRYETARAPAVLHEEGDLTFRVVRDLLSPDVEEFLVDSREVYDRCREYVGTLVPGLVDRVTLYDGKTPIFEANGIEKDIERALRRRVWLKSGGYIVIDHTEALVSIDVNSGKYVGKRDFEQTVLKINMEAVGEVVRQIRLRDLGGIIIIDFIDMEGQEHRDQVYTALTKALVEDKARTNVLEISELGLVEMTRKRVRQDLRALLSAGCTTCRGTGVVKTDVTIAAEVFRTVQARAAESPGKEIVVRVNQEVKSYLDGDGRDALDRLARSLDRKLIVQTASASAPRDEYEVNVR
ncbi:MAG: Rne/Rng family ribonuclease [Candidatus Rokubacteria bacterium]|nr:Rne/Rng family ribonuclease [Candidatus Rokubacteria bacterium]